MHKRRFKGFNYGTDPEAPVEGEPLEEAVEEDEDDWEEDDRAREEVGEE